MLPLVEQIFAPDGPVAATMGQAYERRPEQLIMARAVADALASRTCLVVEAGTGVGKSFAYLVPAILRCVLHSETVVIATHTIPLQEQLVERDIPLLVRALGLATLPDTSGHDAGHALPVPAPRAEVFAPLRQGTALKPALAKGRSNYVSLRRLALALRREERLFDDDAERRSLHAIEAWSRTTTDGSRSSLPAIGRSDVWDRVWDRVQSDSGNCMGRACPRYAECFYQRARAAMEQANLIVTNHAQFCADLRLRAGEGAILPRYDHVIVDEAHGLEEVAAEQFGTSLSGGDVFHLLTVLYSLRTGRGYLAQLAQLPHLRPHALRAQELVRRAADAAGELFQALAERADDSGTVRWRPGEVPNPLSPALTDLKLALGALREQVIDDPDRFELNAYMQRCSALAQAADDLLEYRLEGCAFWASVKPPASPAARPHIELAAAVIDVAPILRQRLFQAGAGVVLTSATLALPVPDADVPPSLASTGDERSAHMPVLRRADSTPFPPTASGQSVRKRSSGLVSGQLTESSPATFDHIICCLGCDPARTLRLGSPFNYAQQVEVYVETSLPPPEADESPAYYDRLADRIEHHVVATRGGALVLFTSHRALNAVARRLDARLPPRGLVLLVQGRDGPRTTLIERLRREPNVVLLGAATFWQGVDVPGEALRNVILTRLPFDPPDHPLTAARHARIRQRGGNPFHEDSLPRAVLRFKQGFGRLVRSQTDRGRVVILDPRVVSKPYGLHFLAALPPGVPVIRT